MNFENLQRELFERKLKIVEYFKKVLEVLKYVIKYFLKKINYGFYFLS